ncbi:MAG: arginyltransferase [Polyangiaceae bacterium]|nr:arginyltransferase [Polyangiaceae bacterium]
MSEPATTVRLIPSDPPELVVHDAPSPCSYLPGRTARLPLRLPLRPLDHAAFEQRLGQGDRRQGRLLYRTSCPGCQACEPIRIDVARFRPSQSQRRAHKKGLLAIRTELGPLELSERRVALYDRHKVGRGLGGEDGATSPETYRAFLVDTCTDSFELRYSVGDELIGVAVTDRAERSLSAVYCYYDPAHEALSPGVFSILQQLELCRRWGLEWLYLGLYVAECSHMSYKARYLPHERLVAGSWQRFEGRPSPRTTTPP